MIVNEIRKAVIDTINFIIPPFAKLTIALLIAYYITYGNFSTDKFINYKELLNAEIIDSLKTIIDKLYLSSVVPIIFILILVATAYLINRITSFTGSLVPITFWLYSTQLPNHFSTAYIWSFYPEIESLSNLENKINQVVEKQKAKKQSPYLSFLKWNEEKLSNEHSYLNYLFFLFIFCIVSLITTKQFLNVGFSNSRFFLFILVLVMLAGCIYLRIAYYTRRVLEVKLMIVQHFIQSENNFTASNEVSKEFIDRVDSQKKYHLKWWYLSVGYRIDWLKMYKHYRLKIPFYSFYKNWKMKQDKKANKPYRR